MVARCSTKDLVFTVLAVLCYAVYDVFLRRSSTSRSQRMSRVRQHQPRRAQQQRQQ